MANVHAAIAHCTAEEVEAEVAAAIREVRQARKRHERGLPVFQHTSILVSAFLIPHVEADEVVGLCKNSSCA